MVCDPAHRLHREVLRKQVFFDLFYWEFFRSILGVSSLQYATKAWLEVLLPVWHRGESAWRSREAFGFLTKQEDETQALRECPPVAKRSRSAPRRTPQRDDRTARGPVVWLTCETKSDLGETRGTEIATTQGRKRKNLARTRRLAHATIGATLQTEDSDAALASAVENNRAPSGTLLDYIKSVKGEVSVVIQSSIAAPLGCASVVSDPCGRSSDIRQQLSRRHDGSPDIFVRFFHSGFQSRAQEQYQHTGEHAPLRTRTLRQLEGGGLLA
ncbi:hypothetical protein EVAR_25405_1 [Eumeta japonica]|uniref:Uncharacterized protein n=1 Tax=Eumeta variegata TaxID=151549 RepID=A0A4C1V6Y3_EUMVA|nr:hypothetical protein EVAR_25405_1 [Eumeta japonica]